jgi:hypothetical protein
LLILKPKAMAGERFPNGIFSNKNPNLGKFWRVLQLKQAGIFYGHLVYLQIVGIVYGNLVYSLVHLVDFTRFGMLYPENLATLGWSHYL